MSKNLEFRIFESEILETRPNQEIGIFGNVESCNQPKSEIQDVGKVKP